jgi:hypothetical protein
LTAKEAKIKCPDCERTFKTTTGLGSHRRSFHKIPGTSASTLFMRRKKHPELAEPPVAPASPQAYKCEECGDTFTKRGTFAKHLKRIHSLSIKQYSPRGTALEPTKAITVQTNGHAKEESHVAPTGYSIPEATLALALGRFQGFSTAMASEFDLPPRLFASELARLIYRSTVR